MPPIEEFRALMERFRAGDPDACEQLVRRYQVKVRAAAKRRLRGTGLAPLVDSVDIAQSVFFAFWRGRIPELNTPEELLAWLVAIVKRKVAEKCRKSMADTRRPTNGTAGGPEGIETAASPIPSSLDDLAEREQRTTDQRRLELALDLLGPVFRQVWELRQKGHGLNEIARATGLAFARVRRILERIRLELDARPEED
jgi:RNA polymerase sigma factor (sigma-70 family)